MGQDNDPQESMNAFAARRNQRQAAIDSSAARAVAHQNYGQLARNGQALNLPRPSDVLAHGVQLRSDRTGGTSAPPTNGESNPDDFSAARLKTPEALLQASTALRSAADTMTFGGADHFAAAMDALLAPGGLERWRQRYQENLQHEQARTRYDATHRPVAAPVGSLGGTLLGIFAVGPEEAAGFAASRLAGAAKLTAKEAGGILGAGGLAGLGSQKLSDVATGHRSSTGDLAGAVAGGIAGAAALPLGPTKAGAVDGAFTSAAQDLFNGRPVSIPQLAQNATGAALLGGLAGQAGRRWSDGLSTQAKGQLGERLGDVRGLLNGERRMRTPKKRAPVAEGRPKTNRKGAYWYPDATNGPIPEDWSQPMPKMYEDKFGYGAALSNNQKLAQALLGRKFQLNHFTPHDVGLIAGLPAAGFGPQIVNQMQGR